MAAITKVFQQAITTYLETNEKTENLKKKRVIGRKQQQQQKTNRNYRTEKYNKIRHLLNGLNSTVHMTGERIHELEHRAIEITQSEEKREKIDWGLKKKT